MRRTLLLLIAAASLLASARAASRPRYGGELRVETAASIDRLDPAATSATPAQHALLERLAPLVFDRLVRIDSSGEFVPQLATTWQHDGTYRRWQFWIRRNVKLHNGAVLNVNTLAQAVGVMNAAWRVRALGEGIVIESDAPLPGLLQELAQVRNSLAVRAGDDAPVGTGAFRIKTWEPGRRAVFVAHDDHWGGRPFTDSISITFNRSLRDQMVDLELGRADVTEVAPEQARRAAQNRLRVSSSEPAELLALVFTGSQAAQDANLRQAVALTVDRDSIQNVIAQRQGEVARGILPGWVSGYGFLLTHKPDVQRARRLRVETRTAPLMMLAYDTADPLARAIAERVAVNAREAGITLQVIAETAASRSPNADARILRVRPGSANPRAALQRMLDEFGRADLLASTADSPEDLYRVERALIDEFRVVPLLHLPEVYGVNNRVRNWIQPREGGWRLDEIWLEQP